MDNSFRSPHQDKKNSSYTESNIVNISDSLQFDIENKEVCQEELDGSQSKQNVNSPENRMEKNISEGVKETDDHKTVISEVSKESESISEEIVLNDSNIITLGDEVNTLSSNLSIPSLNLHSASHDSGTTHTSDNIVSKDVDQEKEESSKLGIEYAEEDNSTLDGHKEDPLNDSLACNSRKSVDSNFDDSLNNVPTGSKIHQNSYMSEDSHNNEDSNLSKNVGSAEVSMNESGDPPLQLSNDSQVNDGSDKKDSSISDDVIKLDIRGQATGPKQFPFIYFYPTPVKGEIVSSVPTGKLNLSPTRNLYFLNDQKQLNDGNVRSTPASTVDPCDTKDDDYSEQDYAVDEIILNQSKEILPPKEEASEKQEVSLSTVTTEYKTLPEDFNVHIHMQDPLQMKDHIVEELKLSLEEAIKSKTELESKCEELSLQISNYHKLLSETPPHQDSSKEPELSDFIRHQGFVNETESDQFKTEEKILSDLSTRDDNLLSHLCKEVMEKLYAHIENFNDFIKENDKSDAIHTKTITLSEVLSRISPDNPELLKTLENIEKKHKNELENLRTYFEDRCTKIKNQYSEEIFSQQSKKASPNSSLDSLDNCPEALPFGSPLHGAGDKTNSLVSKTITRSHSAEFHLENAKISALQQKIQNLEDDYKRQIKNLKSIHQKRITDLESNYQNEISDLKAHIQTLQNSDNDDGILIEQINADKDLEEVLSSHAKSDISTWPREFIAFKEKCEMEMQQVIAKLKTAHSEELSAMENENKKQLEIITDKCKMDVDKWKQKRNDAFDKNRNLEETIKERDGLRVMTLALQKVLSYLVSHFNMCEEELNNTFVGELFKYLDEDDLDNTLLVRSFTSNYDSQHTTSFNVSQDNLEISTMSTKRVHIAPKFSEIMPFIESDRILDCLDKTQDISINFKQELDTCLRRLHNEAQELLLISQAPKRKSILGPNDEEKPTKEDAKLGELLLEFQKLQEEFKRSEVEKRNLEKDLEESAFREATLTAELQTAQEKFSLLHSIQHNDSPESYSPRSPPTRLVAELQHANNEKEDMQMQLEAANKQLRSTKQFLEEQAAEREHERDEFQRELRQLKEDNSKLVQKNQQFIRISKEVDQLETMIKEMTNKINDLEQENNNKQTELTTSTEEIAMLRELIVNLETQLETKTAQEVEVMKDLENFRSLFEEKSIKLREVSSELAILKNDVASKIADDLLSKNKKSDDGDIEAEKQMLDHMRGELQTLVKVLSEHTAGLESLHEAICSQSCSSPSEDVSIRDHRKKTNKEEPPHDISNGRLPVLELWQLGDGLQRHLKAKDAAVKRIKDLEMQLVQLKDVSQELRMERDILQERMSEQSLKISSLQSRLDQTRHTVEAQSYHNMEGLRRQLDEALAEVQLLRESVDSKDKQLKVYEGTPSSESGREYMQRLKMELEEYKTKARDLKRTLDEKMSEFETIIADKNRDIQVLRQQLLERERHLQAVISLQLDEDKEKEVVNDGKLSARTLSDILSISEFDEPDLIVRRAEPAATSFVSGQFLLQDSRDHNATDLPNVNSVMRLQLANSNIDRENNTELLVEEISSKLKDNYLSNQVLSENVSMFPNKNASGEKEVTIQPKRLDFSLSNLLDEYNTNKQFNKNPFSLHNLSLNEPLYASTDNNKINLPYRSLDDLGIVADYQQKVYPDIVSQLKAEIHLLKEELASKTSALRVAQEHISKIPSVKNEMQELEHMLQNSLETMQEDKKYYNNQLENFAMGENILKEKLEQANKEIREKSDEIKILKEDILRRETIVADIYKEKKSVENQLAKLEEKCLTLESSSAESNYLREKLSEFEKLQQLITEKNLQIDNLNENLDKLEDLQNEVYEQKKLNDNLNTNLLKKMKEIAEIQQENQKLKHESDQYSVDYKKLNSDLKRISAKNSDLHITLKLYRDMFTLLEKDLDNIFKKQATSPKVGFGEPIVDQENEEFVKFEEYKQLLSGLEGQKSPNESHSESLIDAQRQEVLNKVRLKINSLQNELHSKRKELSIKALQIEKFKLEIEDLKMQIEYQNKGDSEKNNMLHDLILERDELRSTLQTLTNRLREESNMDELHEKLVKKSEECCELEKQISNIKVTLERYRIENSNISADMEGLKTMLSEREDHITQLLSSIQNLQQEKNKIISILDNHGHSHSFHHQDTNIFKMLNEKLDVESNLRLELEKERSTTEMLLAQIAFLKTQTEENPKTNEGTKNHNGWISQEKFDLMNSKFEKQVEISESLAKEIQLLHSQLLNEKAAIGNLQNILDGEKQHFNKEMMMKNEQNNLIIDLQRKNHELHLELVHVREALHLQKNKYADLEKKLARSLESQKKSETVETYETLLEMETLLRRNINENIQMSETVRELTQERRDLQAKVRQLESQLKLSSKHSSSVLNLPEGIDQQVNYLYGRYMRVESYRKALIWQKRFLVRIAAAGFIIQNWRNTTAPPVQKFKCAAFAIIAISRMKYLVKRWHTGNRIGANIHLQKPNLYPTELRNSKSYSHLPTTSYKGDASKSRHSLSNNLRGYSGGPRLENKTWTGGSNPNISLCHRERLHDWNAHQSESDLLSEQHFGRRSEFPRAVIEETENADENVNQKYTTNKSLTSDIPSTSSKSNMPPREPLDSKLHRALFSPREHNI